MTNPQIAIIIFSIIGAFECMRTFIWIVIKTYKFVKGLNFIQKVKCKTLTKKLYIPEIAAKIGALEIEQYGGEGKICFYPFNYLNDELEQFASNVKIIKDSIDCKHSVKGTITLSYENVNAFLEVISYIKEIHNSLLCKTENGDFYRLYFDGQEALRNFAKKCDVAKFNTETINQ